MKYIGFQIVFNIFKIKKSCKVIGQLHFRLQLENHVLQNHKIFGRITTMVHHLTPKKYILKIHIADIFESSFRQARPNPATICRDIGDLLFQSTIGMLGKTTPKKNFMIKLQFPWISYYKQKANFLPQIVFEILKFKNYAI